MELLDGKKVKLETLENLKEELKSLERKLGLVVIQIGEEPASCVYVNQKQKMAEKVVDISKFLTNAKETEKAYGITVETFGHNGMNENSRKNVKWIAKSIIKDGCVPAWLFKKIMTE